ncbi:hypothetical protein HOO65_010964 [Ceratocystis lukuohia]|uniref:Uncharacterized protein n=1 Tax=Ceratocystis lukuohia TaxID=2019550 RepID=A0ABR4MTL6_9PEZI
MLGSSWSLALVLSRVWGHSNNDQPTPANELGTGDAFATPETPALADLVSPNYPHLGDNGYTGSDLPGGVIGIYSQRYRQGNEDVLQLFIDPETQVITIFENKLYLQKFNGKGRRLELHEVIQGLFSERDMDITTMKWVAGLVDEPYVLKTVRGYRKEKHLGSRDDVRITPADYGWRKFSDLRYYGSLSQIVPGAQVDRLISKYQLLPKISIDRQPEAPEVMALSLKMPSNGDSAAIDPIDEKAAILAAEDNLNAGLQAADAALKAYTKELWRIHDELFEKQAASKQTPRTN